MNKNDYTIRLEKKEDYREVENLVRESFWNVYRPGCLEHYVLKCLRNDPDFVPELDFVMEKDGRIIGQNIFVRTVIKADDGRDIPIMTTNTENQVCNLSTSNCKQVLLLIIDGFGFSQYLWNRSFDSNRTNFTFNENIFSWLSRNNLSKENILGSSYVTDTGAGLAQIYLGQKSGETGIFASKIRKRNDFTNCYPTKSVSPNEFDALFSYKNSITDLVVLGGAASQIYYPAFRAIRSIRAL